MTNRPFRVMENNENSETNLNLQHVFPNNLEKTARYTQLCTREGWIMVSNEVFDYISFRQKIERNFAYCYT